MMGDLRRKSTTQALPNHQNGVHEHLAKGLPAAVACNGHAVQRVKHFIIVLMAFRPMRDLLFASSNAPSC